MQGFFIFYEGWCGFCLPRTVAYKGYKTPALKWCTLTLSNHIYHSEDLDNSDSRYLMPELAYLNYYPCVHLLVCHLSVFQHYLIISRIVSGFQRLPLRQRTQAFVIRTEENQRVPWEWRRHKVPCGQRPVFCRLLPPSPLAAHTGCRQGQ